MAMKFDRKARMATASASPAQPSQTANPSLMPRSVSQFINNSAILSTFLQNVVTTIKQKVALRWPSRQRVIVLFCGGWSKPPGSSERQAALSALIRITAQLPSQPARRASSHQKAFPFSQQL